MRDKGQAARFSDLWDTGQGGHTSGEDRVQAEPKPVNHDANSVTPYARPFGSWSLGSASYLFASCASNIPLRNLPPYHSVIPLGLHTMLFRHLECHAPFLFLFLCIITFGDLHQKVFHDFVGPSVYSYTMYHSVPVFSGLSVFPTRF